MWRRLITQKPMVHACTLALACTTSIACARWQVRRLAEEIMQLSLLEVSDLTEILQKRLNIQMPAMGAMGAGPAAAAPAAAPAAEPAAPEPAKTEFDVKLTGFEASSKVKIIKEVRTMTSLGLKEAKELVRVSAPKPCFVASPPCPLCLIAGPIFYIVTSRIMDTYIASSAVVYCIPAACCILSASKRGCGTGGKGAYRAESRRQEGGG